MISEVLSRRGRDLKALVFSAVTALVLSSCATPPETAESVEAATAAEGLQPTSLQTATLDLESLADARYRRNLGQALAVPEPMAARPSAVELIDCSAQCDAVIPRQTMLTLSWQDPVASPGPMAPSYTDESRIRLDISGTPTGFADGNFGTILLDDMGAVGETVPFTAELAQPAVQGQVLLNRVEAGRIVPRPTGLPLFRSTPQMMQMLPTMPPEMRGTVEREIQTGSISQVRMLGRSSDVVRGSSAQAVTMTGLQPGITYRFRMVEQTADGDRVVVEQICRVPVCPADYVGERE